MSAFLLSTDHIDALVHLALFGPVDGPINWHAPNFSNPSRKLEVFTADYLGRDLERENYASIAARYPKSAPPPTVDVYRFPANLFIVPPRLSTVEALKLLQCYEYQTCEHEAWEASATRRFCDQLKDCLIRTLPGYDAARWDI